MAGYGDEPMSSEEMIRRAREAQVPESSPPVEDDSEVSSEEVEGPSLPAEPEPPRTVDEPAPPPPTLPPIDLGVMVPPTVPAQPEPSQWRKAWRIGRWVVLAIIVLNVISGVLNSDKDVNSLEVGECFMNQDVEVIEAVDKVDCSETHDLELFARVDITGFDDDYPGEEPVHAWLSEQCIDEFEGYVGFDYWTSQYWVFTIAPSDEAWEDGDHLGLCAAYLGDADGNLVPSTGTARSAGV